MEIDVGSFDGLFFGTSRMESVEGIIYPRRMTRLLQDFYSYSPEALLRAKCAAGVCIRFRSVTRSIRLNLVYGDYCRGLYKVDMRVDRGEWFSLGSDEYEKERSVMVDDLGFGEKTIEILLPHTAEVGIRSLEIDDGVEAHPIAGRGLRWLVTGDSISQGMTASTPSRTYASLAADQLDVDLHNAAVGGAVMRAEVGVAAEMEWDFATVAFGVNDYAKNIGLSEFRENTRGILESLRQKGAAVAVITPVPWPGGGGRNEAGLTLADYRAAIAEVADEDIMVIRGERLIPDDAGFFVDNVHPNDRGMKAYAANLVPHLLEYCGKDERLCVGP